MENNTPQTVWNEIRITDEGISVTLYSENTDGAVVEDEVWYTFDELQASGPQEIDSLNLTEQSRNALHSEQEAVRSVEPAEGDTLSNGESPNLTDESLETGDVVIDANAPDWTDDDRLVVKEVLSVRSDEYYIDNSITVSDVNRSYPDSDCVVEAVYFDEWDSCRSVEKIDETETYAFPISRIEERESGLSQK